MNTGTVAGTAKAPGYPRIATEEAWAPPELVGSRLAQCQNFRPGWWCS